MLVDINTLLFMFQPEILMILISSIVLYMILLIILAKSRKFRKFYGFLLLSMGLFIAIFSIGMARFPDGQVMVIYVIIPIAIFMCSFGLLLLFFRGNSNLVKKSNRILSGRSNSIKSQRRTYTCVNCGVKTKKLAIQPSECSKCGGVMIQSI